MNKIRSSRPRKLGVVLLGGALILAAAYVGWRWYPVALTNSIVTRQAKEKRPVPPPIPVTIQVIETLNFPVYLNGLGTVQPYDTVTVRSRVDGQVIKVGFKQGQIVKEGDLLVQIDPRPYQASLEQAKAKKAQDEATLRNAQLDLNRYNTLAQRDFVSRQQLDTQQATVDQLKAQVMGDQAAIDNAATQLSYTEIRSPLTGKSGFRFVDPGNIVHAGDTTGIVTIVKLHPISVVFTAPEEETGKINRALAAGTVPVAALSSDGTKVLASGHLALVDNQIDQASGTIRMKATFQNQDNALWPGLSVATRLLVDTQKNVIAIPNDAIQHGPNGLYVFVVGAGNRVTMRPVKISNVGATKTVVLAGLHAGERAVVAGQYRLTQGAVVAPRPAKSSPPTRANREAASHSQKVD